VELRRGALRVNAKELDAWLSPPGETSRLEKAIAPGLFRRIDVASEPAESPSADDDVALKRLRVTVEEWPALNLRYGLLVAEEFRADDIERRELVPELTADVSRRTLFGRAIAVGVATGWQRRERRIRTFVNTPTLFGLPVESSLIAQRSHEAFEGVSFVTDATGVRWEQRARLLGRLSLSYSYAFDRDRTFDTDPPPNVPALDITINIARLNAASAWDTRDNATETTRGLLASYSLELAPEALGSDIRFVRQVAQTYYFRPWRSLVFASAARFGVVAPLEGQDLIPSERFFSGGSRSVRGVPENGLGPRDFFGDAAGGELMVVLNQEVRLPIYRWLRGVTFVDAGNVFAERAEAGLGDLVGALGVGLRLSTPFALLRVDFAKIAWGAPTASGRWTFGIGHAF
jgi:outer membrane protein insertion porin family